MSMKIAQIAPLYESVPPKLYGGTERVVSYLADGLVRQGHDVTLYASADSETLAELRPMCDKALRLHGSDVVDPLANHMQVAQQIRSQLFLSRVSLLPVRCFDDTGASEPASTTSPQPM